MSQEQLVSTYSQFRSRSTPHADVSCKILTIFFDAAIARGIRMSALCEGLPYEKAYLVNPGNFVDWEVFATFCKNASRFWTNLDFVAIGESAMHSPHLEPLWHWATRKNFSTTDLYRWIAAPDTGGQSFFPCVRAECSNVRNDGLTITVETPSNRTVSTEFFWYTLGTFVAAPLYLGEPAANVHLDIRGSIGLYRISLNS